MKKTNYANSDIMIHRIGFGGWQLGNTEFWGYMSVDEGIQLVRKAISLGVNFFDTAPGYAHGLSEQIIGKAIKDHRHQVVINTKLGHTADGMSDFSVASMKEQILESLNRLDTPYLDSVLLHNPPMEILLGQTDHVLELSHLKEEGLIRAFGVSIDTYEEFEAALNLPIDVIEILFNVFFQSVIPLFPMAKEKHISLIAKVPLDSGWLTGKYDEYAEFEGIRSRWDDETILRRAQLVRDLKQLTRSNDLTRFSIAFILSFPEINVVIPGIKNETHLMDNIHHGAYKLSTDLKQAMIDFYQNKIKDDPLPW